MQRVLIANRGEIAVRIIRGCRKLGLETVAVYSDADAGAAHMQLADQAVRLGPTPAHESYLNVDRVIEAAKSSGADAVHPGYGFLSENADFAERCTQEGLTFIGPGADAMRSMGDKQRAKEAAAACEVPTVPVFDPENVPADAFPVLVKASAGGGGRGMRIVDEASRLPEALAAARREAKAGFGDDTLLVETLLRGARHVEVQLLADGHGTCLYVGDRDCSLQRRHQKVIEEAPAPGLTYDLRTKLGEATVRMARHTGYVNAGTAEFLVTRDGRYFFLELNARLQVEHPVTEQVFGIDLVEWQLRIARGERLTLVQDDIQPLAHAIEARLYAEDPVSFLPTGGRVLSVRLPHGHGIRVDHALQAGADVSLAYDPLLGKLIATGANREEARELLIAALRDTGTPGVLTNHALLTHALELDDFRRAEHSIETLGEFPLDAGILEPSPPAIDAARAQLLAGDELARDPFHGLGAWRAHADPTSSSGAGGSASCEPGIVRDVVGWGDTVYFTVDGVPFEASRDHVQANAAVAAADLHGDLARLTAPMPGTVIKAVAPGTRVHTGEAVVVIEAMKMENAVAAPFDGLVEAVDCAVGDMVAKGAVVAELTR